MHMGIDNGNIRPDVVSVAGYVARGGRKPAAFKELGEP